MDGVVFFARNKAKVVTFSGWLGLIFFLLALLLLNAALGPLTRQTNTAGAVALIVLFVVAAFPRHVESRQLWHLGFGLIAIVALGILINRTHLGVRTGGLFLAGATLYWFGRTLSEDKRKGPLPALLLLTTFLYAVFQVVYLYVPFIWESTQDVSQTISHSVARLFGQRQFFGASAFGVPVLMLFISLCSSAYLLSNLIPEVEQRTAKLKRHGLLRLLLALVALLGIHTFWVVLQEPVLDFLQRLLPRQRYLTPLHLLTVPFVLDVVLGYLYVRTCRFSEMSYPRLKLKEVSSILVGIVFLFGSVMLSWPNSCTLTENNKSVFILNRGYFNWEKPRFGGYGLNSAGMFGLLPDYLQALGYSVSVDSLLGTESLRSVQVLVVINLNRMLDSRDKLIIEKFVEDGGSLLVLGDHTGLGEMMQPLNDLLQSTGIQFNFDSAHYLKDGWDHAFEFMPHAVNCGVENEDDVGISVGASLAVRPFKAWPVMTAKYGFSDLGNWLNRQNAYLGDRRYNPGELLGDVALVAEARFGTGKILVFGDTSPLQNGALARDFRFVDGLLYWLTTSKGGNWEPLRRIIGMLLLLTMVGIVLATVRNHGSLAVVMMAFGGLTLGFVLTSALVAHKRHEIVPRGQVAYIDMSHLGRFGIYGDDGIWSLLYTLMRCDYLPFVHKEFSQAALRESKVFVEIAPAKSLSDKELQVLDAYIRQGGVVVWAVGYEEKEGSANFLRRYGFGIDNVPLGPLPKRETDRGLQFHKAWPVIFTDSTDVEVLCSGWGYPVIVSKTIGKGRLVVIGDAEFLLARNLEGATPVREENVRFIQFLLNSLHEDLSHEAIKSKPVFGPGR